MGERGLAGPVLDVRIGASRSTVETGTVAAVGTAALRAIVGPLLGWPATSLVARLRGTAPHGSVRLAGRRIDHLETAERVRRGLAVVTAPAIAPDVPVRDHLAAFVGRERADEALADVPLLAGRGLDLAGILSGGERRALGWLRAWLQEPMAVALDRPTDGLDDRTVRWATEVVERWQRGGVAVVVDPSRPVERSWIGPALDREDGSST